MRPSNKQRSRNKPGNNGNHNNPRRGNLGNIINRVFESAGPDGKVRGTPQQIIDKYQALARDAQVSGDRVAAESYLQHSEHYSRLLGEAQRQQMENRFNPERDEGPREEGGFDHQRRPQPPAMQPVASGLTTIDPEDSFDMGGPIETPEGQRQPAGGPAPFAVAETVPNGRRRPEPQPVAERPAAPMPTPAPAQPAAEQAAPERPAADQPAPEQPAQAAAPAPAPKRPRRRPRAEAPAPVAQAE
jgi:hypothetical protein